MLISALPLAVLTSSLTLFSIRYNGKNSSSLQEMKGLRAVFFLLFIYVPT